VLLLSQAGTLVSWLVFLAAFALPRASLVAVDSSLTGSFVLTLPLVVLLVARALDGLTGGNVSVAHAYLADISTDSDRSINFGKMAVSGNLSFVLGPAIAGVFGATALGALTSVVATAAISFVATLTILATLPESKPYMMARNPEQSTVRKLFGQEQRDCFEVKGVPQLIVEDTFTLTGVPSVQTVYFLVMLAFNFLYVTFPVFAIEALRWSLPEVGVFFAVMGLFMVLVQGQLLGWVSNYIPEKPLILIGSVTLAASFWLFDSRSNATIYTAVALMALGNGVMWPSVMSVLSKLAGQTYQAAAQGFAGSLGAVTSIAGLVLGGVLYASFGARVFWASAVVILVAAMIGLTVSTPAAARA
jgi:DHA1 family tetracycline resistance protein-like MFS transporter